MNSLKHRVNHLFFPLRDKNPRKTFPAITLGIIIANTIVFGLQFILPEGQKLAYIWGAVPERLIGFWGGETPGLPPAFLTLISSEFLHGGVWHILGNMWFLWLFGDNVEDVLGKGRYLLFYLVGGIVATFAHVLTDPSSQIPLIGASGSISAVLGAYFRMHPKASIKTWVMPLIVITINIPAFIFLGGWFLLQLLNSSVPGGHVAWWAHIGGFLFGMFGHRLFMKHK